MYLSILIIMTNRCVAIGTNNISLVALHDDELAQYMMIISSKNPPTSGYSERTATEGPRPPKRRSKDSIHIEWILLYFVKNNSNLKCLCGYVFSTIFIIYLHRSPLLPPCLPSMVIIGRGMGMSGFSDFAILSFNKFNQN